MRTSRRPVMCLPPIQPIGWCSTDNGGPTTSVSAPRYAIGLRPLGGETTGEVGWSLGESLFYGLGSRWQVSPLGCRRMMMAVYASAQTSSQNQAANSPATGWPGITGDGAGRRDADGDHGQDRGRGRPDGRGLRLPVGPPGSGDNNRRGHRLTRPAPPTP